MDTLHIHPNPETPLAFLPPAIATQLEMARYAVTATCGMFAWDILTNMRNDFKLLTKYHVGFPTVIYFFSRLASLSFIVSSTIFAIGDVSDCQALQVIGVGSCFAVATSLTSLLFLLRVRAIFFDNKWIVAFFLFMWLGTVAGSVAAPFTLVATHIGSSNKCLNTDLKPLTSMGIIILTVNDTLVFFAISWRLLSFSTIDNSFKAKAKAFLHGNGLPALSRSLLQSGQEYYLITVTGNIVTMSMIITQTSLPSFVRSTFPVANVVIANSMACHVFRDIKFGRIPSTSPMTHLVPPTTNTLHLHVPPSVRS